MKSLASCLKQTIMFQHSIISDDGTGGQMETWQDFKSVRAEAKAMYEKAISEVFTSMQFIDSAFFRFKIRFTKEINSNMRIIYNNKPFKIKRIINHNEENKILIILAQESL